MMMMMMVVIIISIIIIIIIIIIIMKINLLMYVCVYCLCVFITVGSLCST